MPRVVAAAVRDLTKEVTLSLKTGVEARSYSEVRAVPYNIQRPFLTGVRWRVNV